MPETTHVPFANAIQPDWTSWCEVDTDALRSNISILSALTNAKKLLVVKDNAYGHGADVIAHATHDLVDAFGVVSLAEARALRHAGISTPIMIIATIPNEHISSAVSEGFAFLAWREDQFAIAEASSAASGQRAHLHFEIDSGMARSGVRLDEAVERFRSLSATQRALVDGVMTHYYSAAPIEDPDVTRALNARFARVVDALRDEGFSGEVHAANSAALLRFPETHFDMVRIGLIAYGQPATKFHPVPNNIKPILSLRTRLTHVSTLQPGEGVSYGWRFVAERPTRIGALPIGYAFGLHPFHAPAALLHGRRTQVLGRVCMDQMVIEIPDGLDAQVGDVVTLIGSDGDEEILVGELAESWGTNRHAVCVGLRRDIPRVGISPTP